MVDSSKIGRASTNALTYRQIRDPVTELIVTRRDEATPLAVEGVANIKPGVAAVAVFGEVWGLKAIAQEGGISPFLSSQLGPVDC